MARTTGTPANLVIHKRDWKFGRATTHPRWWHSGDPGRTAFFNALSSTFPLGEKFFIASVRYFHDATSEPLRSQIDHFMFQEAMHSREHAAFNRQAEAAGYDIQGLEERTRRSIALSSSRPPLQKLAATCALEHFTAVLARSALADPAHFVGVPTEAAQLWRWHAVEEIEHKAVAFDTWLHATRHRSGLRRWTERCMVMFVTTVRFHWVIYRNTADLLKQDGKNTIRTWFRLLGYLYGKPGPMRRLLQGIIRYFRPGFHPWQMDDRALLSEALANLSPQAGSKAAPAAGTIKTRL